MSTQTAMKSALLTATLLLSPCALASESVADVPARFVGLWAGSPDACGSDADDMVLRIAPRHIAYWESEGPILAVVVQRNEIAVISELSGEGETWLSTATFTLSDDGRRLSGSGIDSAEPWTRYRCRAREDVRLRH